MTTVFFLYFFTFFIQNIYFSFILHEHLRAKYPIEYENFLLSCAHQLVRWYSIGQIAFNKVRHRLETWRPIVHSSLYIHNSVENDATVEYITEGEIFHSEKLNTYIITLGLEQFNYDFAIVSHSDGRKRIIKHMQNWDNSFDKSEVQFVLIEALYKDKRIKLDLKTDDYNFYLINNRIDDKFMYYFLKNYQKIEDLTKDDMKNMVITVLDQNVVSFDCYIEKDYIYISNTNYFRKSDIITED